MAFTVTDLLNMATRDYILGNTTQEEQIQFIEDQIKDPFNSGDNNYVRKLKKMLSSRDEEMDEICLRLFTQIQDIYSHLKIDVSDYDQRFFPLFNAVYKFFVKNIAKLTYVFIREFLFNNKNRKVLTEEFSSMKLPTYPKEQYGKKDFYILIIKLPQIIDEIFDDDVKLKKFISYIEKSSDCPLYISVLKDAMEDGLVVDNGVVGDIYKLFKRSEHYRSTLNKLEMDITQSLIIPYMEENGMMSIRMPKVEDLEPNLSDDDDDEDDD